MWGWRTGNAHAYIYHGLTLIPSTQVWGPDGTLLGKFFLGTTSANMIFAGKGRLVIMGETAIYLAEIAASGFNLAH